jgi:hypothetical protein
MILIGDGIEHSDDCGNNECLTGNHKRLKSAKEEKVKYCIFSDMSPFFNKTSREPKLESEDPDNEERKKIKAMQHKAGSQ